MRIFCGTPWSIYVASPHISSEARPAASRCSNGCAAFRGKRGPRLGSTSNGWSFAGRSACLIRDRSAGAFTSCGRLFRAEEPRDFYSLWPMRGSSSSTASSRNRSRRRPRRFVSLTHARGLGSTPLVSRSTRKRTRAESSAGVRARTVVRRSGRAANPRQGPSVASFLEDEGLYEAASARAIKEVLVFQIEAAMARDGVTKADLARRMATSRAAVDRLLDPENASVTLGTLLRASIALGADLTVELRASEERLRKRSGAKPKRR